MRDRYLLLQRDGKVYVCLHTTATDEPVLIFHWWLTKATPKQMADYGIADGTPVRPNNDGTYQIEGRGIFVAAINGGATLAERVERVSAPGPDARKVRRRAVRWYQGGWQVLSKREGWIAL